MAWLKTDLLNVKMDFNGSTRLNKEIYTKVWSKLHLERPTVEIKSEDRSYLCQTRDIFELGGNRDSEDDSVLSLNESIYLQELEAALEMEETLNNLRLDINEKGVNESIVEAGVVTSTPMDKSKIKQEESLMLTDDRSKPSTDSADSGITELAETTSSNKTPSDPSFSSSSDENIAALKKDCAEVVPIYSFRDAGLWYSSSGSERDSSEERLRSFTPDDLSFEIEKSRQSTTAKLRSRRKKALLLPNERLSESDDELICGRSYRKKYAKQLWMDIKARDNRDPHLEDRRCTREEKNRRSRARKKDMRKLRQFFCKKEFFRLVKLRNKSMSQV